MVQISVLRKNPCVNPQHNHIDPDKKTKRFPKKQKTQIIKQGKQRSKWKSGSYKVAGEDDFSAMTHQVLDGGHSGTDSGVIGDLETLIQRNIQINPHKHPLPLQIRLLQITHTPLCCHCSSAKFLRRRTWKNQIRPRIITIYRSKKVKFWRRERLQWDLWWISSVRLMEFFKEIY